MCDVAEISNHLHRFVCRFVLIVLFHHLSIKMAVNCYKKIQT